MATTQPRSKPLSQAEYQETPYVDESWEIVGELIEHNEFVPMEIAVMPRKATVTDPMFQDFGGVSAEGAKKRLHVPKHAGANAGREKALDPDVGKIKILPEELEALKSKAYEEGLKAGMAKGQEDGAGKLQLMQKGLQTVLQDLAQQVNQNLRAVEKNAVDLAVAIGEKTIGYAVEINPEYIGRLTHEALKHAGGAVVKKVRVSPQDMEFIEVVGISQQGIEFDASWKFEKDETIKAGCVVETSAGELDFRIDQAWERMKDQIVKVTR